MGDFLRGLLAHLDFLRLRYEVELLMAGCRISDTSANQENHQRQQKCADHASRLRPLIAVGWGLPLRFVGRVTEFQFVLECRT